MLHIYHGLGPVRPALSAGRNFRVALTGSNAPDISGTHSFGLEKLETEYFAITLIRIG
jgi:hypothetical protein